MSNPLRADRIRRLSLAGRMVVPARLRHLPRLHRYGGDTRILLLAIPIGIVAGLGALLFKAGIEWGTHFFLTGLGGYTPATTIGEGGGSPASAFLRPWAIPLVVGLGGLIAGFLVFTFAPEAEGHGTDAAIKAIHEDPTRIRARVVFIKLIASAVTIGSGGSGGREGPTAQISSGAASMLARRLHLSLADARLLVTAGMASGIASIFRAPLGGALLGVELLYSDDLEADALMPSLVASVVGYLVYGTATGFQPIFGAHTTVGFGSAAQFPLFAILGLAAGYVARMYAWMFYATARRFASMHRIPDWVRPGLAGLLVGAIGLAIPGVLGTGYGTVSQMFSAQYVMSLPILVLLLVPIAKIVATSLSIGSGGSGGVFGPGMVIGATLGAAAWRIAEMIETPMHLEGTLSASPDIFVFVGMVAVFGAISHAPLAMMLMVAEMTGDLGVVAPAMLALAISALVVGPRSIYRSQLPTRFDRIVDDPGL